MSHFSFDQYKASKSIALLIDPDKGLLTDSFVEIIVQAQPDFIFVGGTQPFPYQKLDNVITKLKVNTTIPIIGFPGSNQQIHPQMDALLALMMLQSYDANFVLRQLVEVASDLRALDMKTILTPYLLLDHRQSNTALSRLLGDKIEAIDSPQKLMLYLDTIHIMQTPCFYLEAGSGAGAVISAEYIQLASERLPNSYVIIGGGIDTIEKAGVAWNSGADCVVVGNAIEKNPRLLIDFCRSRDGIHYEY